MASFLKRWIDRIAYLLVSWIVWPIVTALLILGSVVLIPQILIDIFSYLNPLWAFLAIVALAVSVVALLITIVEA